MKTRHDQDYRGQTITVDWSRLVYMARRNRSGAMEVLQDAILTYFPKQFAKAQAEARAYSRRTKKRHSHPHDNWMSNTYVLFRPRTARRRFETKKKRVRHYDASNFANRMRALRGLPELKKKKYYANLPHPKSSPFSIESAEGLEEDAIDRHLHIQAIPVWSTNQKLAIKYFGSNSGWR